MGLHGEATCDVRLGIRGAWVCMWLGRPPACDARLGVRGAWVCMWLGGPPVMHGWRQGRMGLHVAGEATCM